MRDPFSGYDQWKTASPYDDYPDCSDFELENGVPGFPARCPACGGTAEFIRNEIPIEGGPQGSSPMDIEEMWHCEECDWEQEVIPEDYANNPRDSFIDQIQLIRKRLNAVEERQHKVIPLEDMNLPEGDFDWTDTEAGDWEVYHCGERDCPIGWHKIAFATNIKRENGVLSIDIMDVDEDGNWDFNEGWTDNPEDKCGPFEESYLARSMSRGTDDYFRGWVSYWLDCAETMDDPLGEAIEGPQDRTPHEWIEFCLHAALNDLVYLEGKGNYLLPRYENVEVHFFDEEDPQAFQLIFNGGMTPYISEVYHLEEDEFPWEAASRIMRKFDWVGDKVPNSKEWYEEKRK